MHQLVRKISVLQEDLEDAREQLRLVQLNMLPSESQRNGHTQAITAAQAGQAPYSASSPLMAGDVDVDEVWSSLDEMETRRLQEQLLPGPDTHGA